MMLTPAQRTLRAILAWSVVALFVLPIYFWITVAFTIVVFALFSSMSDVERAFSDQPQGDDLAGSFVCATTGETVGYDIRSFETLSRNYAKLVRMTGGDTNDLDEDQIWAFAISVADAQGAGLRVSDRELGSALSAMMGGDAQLYERIVLQAGFPSKRAFETFFRKVLIAQRWQQAQMQAASVLPAEDVYQRWRSENELFDMDVLLFADRDTDSIPAPGPEALREFWDELPDFRRESLFKEPARHDIAFGAMLFTTDPDPIIAGLSEDLAKFVKEPDDAQIAQRFQRVKRERYPDLEEPDEVIEADLRRELKVLSLATRAHTEFRLLPEEERTIENFRAQMELFGLTVSDPEGLLGPEEVEALEPIGDELLGIRLQQMRKAGDSQTLTSVSGKESAAGVVYLQDLVEARPLSFEEAGDKVLEEWRKTQADQEARDFRDALAEATRALPEAAAEIAEIEARAAEEALARITAAEAAADAGPGAPPVDDEMREQIRDEALAAVQPEIDVVVQEHAGEVWEPTVAAWMETLGDRVERVTYDDVPANTRSKLTADERDPNSVEQFVKTHFSVLALDAGGVTDVLRLPVAETSAVVRVADRSYPPMSEMLADEEGMDRARQTQAQAALTMAQIEFMPAAIMESHGLRRPERTEPGAEEGEEPAAPAGS